jgi:hypothetical protein
MRTLVYESSRGSRPELPGRDNKKMAALIGIESAAETSTRARPFAQ